MDIRHCFLQLATDSPCPEDVVHMLETCGELNQFRPAADVVISKTEACLGIKFADAPRLEICVSFTLSRLAGGHSIEKPLNVADLHCCAAGAVDIKHLMLDTEPITHTSKMERLVGYGTALARSNADFRSGDVLVAHSVSGRNPVTVEVAQVAKDAGAKVVAVTNLKYSQSVASRHPSGKRLFELADIVLDNHGLLDGGRGGEARVEGGVGVLEDHLDVLVDTLELGPVELGDVLVAVDDLARGGAVELDDAAAERGLSAARLADDAEGLSFIHVERDVRESMSVTTFQLTPSR